MHDHSELGLCVWAAVSPISRPGQHGKFKLSMPMRNVCGPHSSREMYVASTVAGNVRGSRSSREMYVAPIVAEKCTGIP